MSLRKTMAATTLAFAALTALTAQATTVAVVGDGRWYSLDVDDLLSATAGTEWIDVGNGSALTFTFTVPTGAFATLTVVDAGFAGDTFSVFSGATLLGSTSGVPQTDAASAPNLGTSFDAALANPAFSRGVFNFGPGSYEVRGQLLQSVLAAGAPLNATVGGLNVTVVPEPATALSLFAGLALVGAALRRRA